MTSDAIHILSDDATPAPLTPPDCNLRDFPYMPLQVNRLRASKAWLKCKRNPALAFYMLNLWSASWNEVPAASLENDDDVLADKAMCPPDVWETVKDAAMYGWVLATDGRWYHPTVAEQALSAWTAKQEKAVEREHEAERKRREREERANLFLELKKLGIVPPFNTRMADLRELLKTAPKQPVGRPADIQGRSRLGKGIEGKGEGEGNTSLATHPPAAGEPPPEDPAQASAKTPAKPPAHRPARELPEEQDAPTNAIWRAYASTYREVYDVEPVRNAKVNGQLAQLLQRIGRDDAVQVAAWYVRQNEAFLRAKHHPIDLLLRDCEGLRTRWKRWEAGHAELATHGHGHGPPPTTTISAAGHQTLLNAEAARRRLFPKSNGEPE